MSSWSGGVDALPAVCLSIVSEIAGSEGHRLAGAVATFKPSGRRTAACSLPESIISVTTNSGGEGEIKWSGELDEGSDIILDGRGPGSQFVSLTAHSNVWFSLVLCLAQAMWSS